MEWRKPALCVLVLALTWGLQTNAMRVSRRNHVDNICSMWGNFHFKTFDGDVYKFQGTCEYNLVSECHRPVQGFSVHIKRSQFPGDPQITRVLVTIGDMAIILTKKMVMINGEIVKLPYYLAGVLLEESAIYTKLYAKLGLSVMWNRKDAVMVELESKYSNYTCGLCGDFNGIPIHNEFLSEARVIGSVEFGNKQRILGPNDICEDPYEEDDTDLNTVAKCQIYREDCSALLQSEAWSSCRSVLSPEPYIKTCMVDRCWSRPGDMEDTSLCSTLSEYSRQCSHAGGKPPNWRTPTLCEIQCPFNMEYSESGSPCVDTCTHRDTSLLCEEHKMDGCYCPLGTVFDDISKNGCIPQEKCQCKHNQVYNPGDVLHKDDEECVCQNGTWWCEHLPVPGVCALEEGSHFTTYDGKEFTFHGDCYYVLSKDCVGSTFLILGQLIPCVVQKTDTCLKSIALLLNNDKKNALIIKDDGLVRHNGDITLPYTTTEISVFKPSSFHIMVQTSFGLQIQVQLVPLMQLYITLEKSFQNKTCGLCGNFNMVLSDELKTPQGLAEGTSASFGNSWKAQANCPDSSDRLEDPCSYSIDSESYAEHWCSKLKDKEGQFAKCHSTVNPDKYYKRCKYSSCTCEKSEDCLCAVFSSYVRACTTKGIFLQGWRHLVCEKYTERCHASQTYSYLLQGCQRTCDSLGSERQVCNAQYTPVDGCACPDGLYEDNNGLCVPMDKCTCYHNGEHVKPGKSINIRNEHCVCMNGNLNCHTWKARVTGCPAPKVFFNCSNAAIDKHGLECAQTCSHHNVDCYLAECESGCQCPTGLLDDGLGHCVKEHECPCQHNGHFYAAGAKITDDCNTCTCKYGKWECTDKKCPGTCTIYGSGHYNTFDKQRFGFSGDCGYVAVQNKCGNKTGTFHVITENVPCGTTGTTCSKAVRILLGKTQLELRDGVITDSHNDTGSKKNYKVRNVGLYLVIETDVGLAVLWDRKTTVRIILQPQHMGEVCGLCGNYNGNGKDDFTTQGQLQVSDIMEFVNSWKVYSSCPDAEPDFDPCFERPNRHTWAKMQCSIIRGDTFKDCHKMVDPTPYFENCVRDSCACDTGGDCECFCTAVAAYAQACNEAGVCVAWRSPEICPVFCDYYNEPDECVWHYSPCHTPCYKTCLNPLGYCRDPLPNLEGCYPVCPDDKPFFDEKNHTCVDTCDPRCFINGTVYNPGEEIPSSKPCYLCYCSENGNETCLPRPGCCYYNGTEYGENETIYEVTDNMGMCYSAICINSTVVETSEPCPPTSSPQPETTSYITTTKITLTTTVPTPTSTTKNVLTSAPTETTPCVICEWSEWYNVDYPTTGSDIETYENIKNHGKKICDNPEDIQCRAVSMPDMPLEEFTQSTGQVVHCNVSFGLVCKKDEQTVLPYKCVDYKIRVLCCEPCATPTPETTVTGVTSGPTTPGQTTKTDITVQTGATVTTRRPTPISQIFNETTVPTETSHVTTSSAGSSSSIVTTIPVITTRLTTSKLTETTGSHLTSTTAISSPTAESRSTPKTMKTTTGKTTKATTTPLVTSGSTREQTSEKPITSSPSFTPTTITATTGSPHVSSTTAKTSSGPTGTQQTSTPVKTTRATSTPLVTSGSTREQTSEKSTAVTTKSSTTSPVSIPIVSTSPLTKTTITMPTSTQTTPVTTGKTSKPTFESSESPTTFAGSTTSGETSQPPITPSPSFTPTTITATTGSPHVSSTTAKTSSGPTAPTQSPHISTTLTKTSPTSKTTEQTSSTGSSGTTLCFCVIYGKHYEPGETILNMTDIGSGICLTMICSASCEIQNTTELCPVSPSPPPKFDCPPWQVNTNMTFEICECIMAKCIEDNVIEIIPYECPPIQNITCSNKNVVPVNVSDENHCCYKQACDCVCEGWGDPHYITFDGLFYSYQGNCTYVLMEEITPKHNLKIYIDNVKCDPREPVSCPRAIIVHYNNIVITLKNNNLVGAASLEALIGHKVLRLPFAKNGIQVVSSGVNLIVEIPLLQVVVTFGVTGFRLFLPFHHFGNNTQGHCGTCNNNQADDCMLPGGEIIDKCEVMADYWPAKDLYNPDCPVPPLVPTLPPTKPSCPPNPVCELLKSNLFKECHPFISPDNYFMGCQFDSCHMTNPAVVCTSLQTYSLACSQFGICLHWRNHTDLCAVQCPGDKVYKPCGPADPPSCQDRPDDRTMNVTTEGCFCPEGTLLFNKESGVCVEKCGCLDPSGQAREPGEEFQHGCQDCVCDESTVSVICKAKQCPNPGQITCSEPGFIPVNVTDPSDACCTILACHCDSRTCPSIEEKCKIGYSPVLQVPEGKCCPELICEPKKVCVHKNMEYAPGSTVPVIDCQECNCTWDVDPKTQLHKIQCGFVTCNEKCQPGYEYVESNTECCGKCVQSKCLVNYNGTKRLLRNGTEWAPRNTGCNWFTCTYIGGEYITTRYKTQCPPFNVDNCKPGTIQLSSDGCCQTCVEKEKGCKVQTTSDYIIHNNCISDATMEQTHCQGDCNSYSKYSELGSSTCSCCQATRTSNRTVTLNCMNGDTVTHTYVHVEECSCKNAKCQTNT